MITISEYIAYLTNQVVQARAMADAETARVARAYAANDVMKHFPVPRFRLPEVDLSIPFVVNKADIGQTGLTMTEEQFLQKMKTASATLLTTYRTRSTNLDDAVYADLRTALSQLYQTFSDAGLPLSDRLLKVQGLLPEFFNKALSMGGATIRDANAKDADVSRLTRDVIGQLRDAADSPIEQNKLKSLSINPEADILNAQHKDISIFRIKAKLVEEAFFIESVKDENGTERMVVNFD